MTKKGPIGHYKYAMGEPILVMVGILLSLQESTGAFAVWRKPFPYYSLYDPV